MPHGSTRKVIAGAVLAASLCCIEMALAQSQVTAPLQPAGPMTTEERRLVESSALSDARVRAIIGPGAARVTTTGAEFDKAEAQAFLEGRSTTPPTRRVTVIIFNPQTNQAVRALVHPSENRVIAAESIAATNVPFTRDDADKALALAKDDPAVRRAVGDTLPRFELLESGSDARIPFAAQAHPLRSTDPRDACSTDRCLAILFRTEAGYLGLRALVNVTKGTVEVRGGGQHR